MVKIIIASDHAGFLVKEFIKKILVKNKIDYEDVGTFNEIPVDYPDFAKEVAERVIELNKKLNVDLYIGEYLVLGILICGTGAGMQISANKIKGIRAVFCYDEYSAIKAREDNNANILTLRARNFNKKDYEKIIMKFIGSEFSNLQRHIKRINKIEEFINN